MPFNPGWNDVNRIEFYIPMGWHFRMHSSRISGGYKKNASSSGRAVVFSLFCRIWYLFIYWCRFVFAVRRVQIIIQLFCRCFDYYSGLSCAICILFLSLLIAVTLSSWCAAVRQIFTVSLIYVNSWFEIDTLHDTFVDGIVLRLCHGSPITGTLLLIFAAEFSVALLTIQFHRGSIIFAKYHGTNCVLWLELPCKQEKKPYLLQRAAFHFTDLLFDWNSPDFYSRQPT